MIEFRFSDSTSKHNEILKVIAIITMVIDHVGYFFFPEWTFMRVIGRIAFPIFAYQIAKGYLYTSNKHKYMLRLWLFALLSQIPYTLLLNRFDFNILFTLLLAVLFIDRIHKKEWYWTPLFLLVVTIPQFIPTLPSFDYSWYGLITPLFFYLFRNSKNKILISQLVATIAFILSGMTMKIQLFAIVGVLLCLYFPMDKWKVHLNKYFFYWFYPAHLVIILLIQWFLIFR